MHKTNVKKMASRFFVYSGIAKFSHLFEKKGIRVLMYHQVDEKRFEEQMQFVKKRYSPVSLHEAVRRTKENRIEGREIVVTFDDGYLNNFLYAYPILKKLNIPATIFLTTSYIGTGELAWWDKIDIIFEQHKELPQLKMKSKEEAISYLKHSDNSKREEILRQVDKLLGEKKPVAKYQFISWNDVKSMRGIIDFGAHTHTHPILTKCHDKEAEKEILESRKNIESILKRKVLSFAYPNGSFSEREKRLVEKVGFECAVATTNGLFRKKRDLFQINRIGINESDGLTEFRLKLSPLWQMIK